MVFAQYLLRRSRVSPSFLGSDYQAFLIAAMIKRNTHSLTAFLIAALTTLSACAAGRPPVVEMLDEQTGVSVTYSRTPIILSPDTPFDRDTARDFVQVGAIEVNRMGSLQYFLWFGITDKDHLASGEERPNGFESIVLIMDGETVPLEVHGWTEESVNVSAPVYKKLYATSADAYYPVTLDQLQMLTEVDSVVLRITDPTAKEFIPWYKQITARDDLLEFLRTVRQ